MRPIFKIIIVGILLLFNNEVYSQYSPGLPCGRGDKDPNNPNGNETIDPNALDHEDIDGKASEDPNEIVGIDGWLFVANGDTVRWVSASHRLSYTIYFENDPLQATASAQVVTVRLPLDPLMNLQDFAIGTFGFSNKVFPIEGNSPVYQTRLDLVQEMNLYVDVVAGIDITTNEAFWIFSSIDPVTGVAPTETDRGFLPVNDSTHAGEGFVTFTIKPKTAQCHTGDSIVAQATIVFDDNDPIETNRWVNSIDAVAPVSTATVIEDTLLRPADTSPNLGEEPDSLRVIFSGMDDTTGIAAYRLYYTEGRSAFRLAGRYLPGDTAVLEKNPNVQHTFFSIAEDNVGNIEPMKNAPDTLFGNTRVNLLATVNPAGAATITGTGTYNQGDTATLTLHPATGYRLTRWVEAGIPQGTDTLLSRVADANHGLIAEMERLNYPLTVEAAEGTTIEVTSAGTPVYQTIQHFDTLNIHLAASPCYQNVTFTLNGQPLTLDTTLVVTEAVTLTSTATTHIDTGYVYDTVCPGTAYTANGFNILSTATQTAGSFRFQVSSSSLQGCDSVTQLSLYVKNSHSITFLANGGTGSMPIQRVCEGDATVLNRGTYSREGYYFAGWAMSASDTSPLYSDGDIINANNDITLYAVWSSSCVDRISNRMVTICDNYSWRGQQHTASGDYSDTVTGVVPGGCDSIYQLHLTLKQSTTNTMEIVACQPYTWVDGQTYATDTTRMLSMTNSVGCDSTITLHLTMSEAIFAIETVTACNSFVWHNIEYTASTDTANFISANTVGCDSVTTLHLTINYCSTTTITACDSYTWHGENHTTSGTYVDGSDTLCLTINYSSTADTNAVACDTYNWYEHTNLTASSESLTHIFTGGNQYGCDSTVTLNLTVNYSSTGDTNAVACDTYNWYEHTGLTATSDNLTHLFAGGNQYGCDSTVTLNLTVNYSSTGDTSAVACDTYNWYEHTGLSATSDNLTHLFEGGNQYGCDSTVTLHLTVNYQSYGDTTAVACDSYDWYEHTGLTGSSDNLTHLFEDGNQYGCDSTVTLNLTVNYSSTGDTNAVACDTYNWYEHNGLTASSDNLTHLFVCGNQYGCDSTVTLSLTINNSSTGDTNAVACDTYNWYEHTNLTASSNNLTHLFVGGNQYGCDSTVTLNLTVNYSSTGDTNAVACDTYNWYEYTGLTANSDNLTHLFVGGNQYGCDSTVTLNLTVNYSSTGDTNAVACDTYNWYEHNGLTASSDNLPHLFVGGNQYGCDSTVTLNLTVHYSSTGDTNAVACDTYNWYEHTGLTASSDNLTHLFVGGNQYGCDSTVTLNLTVNYSSTGDTTAVACDTYNWYEHTGLTASSDNLTHLFVGGNQYGCDSTVTLSLTINYSSTGDTNAVACDSYNWYEHTGLTASSDNLTHLFVGGNQYGCDSTVTLSLTINYSSTGDTNAVACDSYNWYEHTGLTASSDNLTHLFIGGNQYGCDSTVTLNLTVNYSSTGDTNAVACDSYTWQGNTYTSSAVVHGGTTLLNAAGCDSTVTLHLTVNYSNTGVDSVTACDSCVWQGVTYTVSTNEPSFTTTNAAGCDSTVTLHLTVNYSVETIVTDTSESGYTWHGATYNESGTYQWQGTTTEGCDSTVTLILVINSVGIEVIDGNGMIVNVHPNPTSGLLTIDADDVLTVEVFDQSGRHIATHDNTNCIDLGGLPTGNYILMIRLQRGQSVQRVILR